MAQYKGAASEAGRAMQLMKKREKEREQLEQLKQKIAEVWNFSLLIITSSIIVQCQWELLQPFISGQNDRTQSRKAGRKASEAQWRNQEIVSGVARMNLWRF